MAGQMLQNNCHFQPHCIDICSALYSFYTALWDKYILKVAHTHTAQFTNPVPFRNGGQYKFIFFLSLMIPLKEEKSFLCAIELF
jgi:hypothetical protein